MSMFGFTLPKDFLIGTANSAFQSEGAWDPQLCLQGSPPDGPQWSGASLQGSQSSLLEQQCAFQRS